MSAENSSLTSHNVPIAWRKPATRKPLIKWALSLEAAWLCTFPVPLAEKYAKKGEQLWRFISIMSDTVRWSLFSNRRWLFNGSSWSTAPCPAKWKTIHCWSSGLMSLASFLGSIITRSINDRAKADNTISCWRKFYSWLIKISRYLLVGQNSTDLNIRDARGCKVYELKLLLIMESILANSFLIIIQLIKLF